LFAACSTQDQLLNTLFVTVYHALKSAIAFKDTHKGKVR